MLKRCMIAAVLILSAGTASAQNNTIDKDFWGTWALKGKNCSSEPRFEVTQSAIVMHNNGKAERYTSVDQSLTCYSGASRDSITVCVSPVVNDRYPFSLVFNPGEKEGLMRFEAGSASKGSIPADGKLYSRCKV